MRAKNRPATGKPADPPSDSIIAPWWPVHPAGSLHGPVYDDKGRRKNRPEAPIGWLGVDGKVQPDRPEYMSTQGLIVA